jgi:hypothetical protein
LYLIADETLKNSNRPKSRIIGVSKKINDRLLNMVIKNNVCLIFETNFKLKLLLITEKDLLY